MTLLTGDIPSGISRLERISLCGVSIGMAGSSRKAENLLCMTREADKVRFHPPDYKRTVPVEGSGTPNDRNLHGLML